MTETGVYIRFTSHRARHYGLDTLSYKPRSFYSFYRKTHPGGVYLVQPDDLPKIQAESHAHFTKLRGPYDDLRECWE